MRRPKPFHLSVAAVIVLGLAVVVVAALGSVRWALALGGLSLSALAVLLFLLDRRVHGGMHQVRKSAERARRSADNAKSTAHRALQELRRVETLVDATQRRIVSSLEAARVEAAERHRSAVGRSQREG